MTTIILLQLLRADCTPHPLLGVGRTGTLIVLKLQMRLLAEEQMIDIFGITKTLRQCRKLMVQAEVNCLVKTFYLLKHKTDLRSAK